MTKNISQAQDAANAMVDDCQRKIDELTALKEMYQQLGKKEEYNADPDIAAGEIKNFIVDLQKANYPYPIRGVFDLATQFHSIDDIDSVIKAYEETGNRWIKIRDQLGQE